MLKKEYRLKNTKAFDATYKQKQVVSNNLFRIFIGRKKANENIDLPIKLGFVVSKKYHKRAVKRNRIKRLMREAFRLLIMEQKLGNANLYMSLIVQPKNYSYDLSLNDVKTSIIELLEKIRG